MRWLIVSLAVVGGIALCFSQTGEKAKTISANLTFIVDGLHCENCVANLTKALKSVNGVQKAEVSLKEKRAFVILDESKTPVSNLVAQTHQKVSYRLNLLLPIENWGKVDQNKAIETVKRLKGVTEVKADKAGLLLSFNPKETVRYSDLAEALNKAGFRVLNPSAKANGNEHSGSHDGSEQGNSQEGSCCSDCQTCS